MREYQGQQGFSASASAYNAETFRVRQLLRRINTAEPVRVVSVHPGSGATGTVDVLPLVRLVAGDGQGMDQSVLFTLPYLRVQGGKNALIIDPQPGDVGLAVYAMRDTEAVKAMAGGDAAPVNPGSARAYDKGDGFYLGGFLNAQPERFVRIDDSGVTIEGVAKIDMHGEAVTITAEAGATINADVTINGNLLVNGSITWTGTAQGKDGASARFAGGLTNTGGEITSNGVSLDHHPHGGVEPGSGNTGGPQ